MRFFAVCVLLLALLPATTVVGVKNLSTHSNFPPTSPGCQAAGRRTKDDFFASEENGKYRDDCLLIHIIFFVFDEERSVERLPQELGAPLRHIVPKGSTDVLVTDVIECCDGRCDESDCDGNVKPEGIFVAPNR